MHPTSVAHELSGWHFGVDHTCSSGHPLNATRRQTSGMPAGILMLHLTREHVRHGLESAMRMVGRAFRLTWRNINRPHLIK
jgi:hypothetical protein